MVVNGRFLDSQRNIIRGFCAPRWPKSVNGHGEDNNPLQGIKWTIYDDHVVEHFQKATARAASSPRQKNQSRRFVSRGEIEKKAIKNLPRGGNRRQIKARCVSMLFSMFWSFIRLLSVHTVNERTEKIAVPLKGRTQISFLVLDANQVHNAEGSLFSPNPRAQCDPVVCSRQRRPWPLRC